MLTVDLRIKEYYDKVMIFLPKKKSLHTYMRGLRRSYGKHVSSFDFFAVFLNPS